jgi:hypothetical protein
MRVFGWWLAAAMGAGVAGAQTPVKQPIQGLVSMGLLHFQTHPGEIPADALLEARVHPDVYAGVVINVLWSQLEPERGKFDHRYIEHALEEIRAYNKAHAKHPVVGKLRVDSGRQAPAWAMALDGPAVIVQDNHDPAAVPVGRYWTANYAKAWSELQADLAAAYDANPLVGEVGISSCSTVTDEPFVPAGSPESRKNLAAAGLTDELREHCLMHAWEDYSAWKLTPMDYPVNPYRRPGAAASEEGQPVFTIAVMKAFRAALGGRAVIGNHGLQSTLKVAAVPLYAEFRQIGPPLELQFFSPKVDPDASVQLGLATGATEIEVWHTKDAGGLCAVSYAMLERWAAEMKK